MVNKKWYHDCFHKVRGFQRMEKQKSLDKCHNELQQELGFKDNHPLVLCIRCLRFIDRFKFGRSIYNKDLRICCRCCEEEKATKDKEWIKDLEDMRKREVGKIEL